MNAVTYTSQDFLMYVCVFRMNVISSKTMLGLFKKRQQFTKEQTLSQEAKIKLHRSFSTHNKSQESMQKSYSIDNVKSYIYYWNK